MLKIYIIKDNMLLTNTYDFWFQKQFKWVKARWIP